MSFYLIYARTKDSQGNQISIPPGTVERVVLECQGDERQALEAAENANVVTPGTQYGVRVMEERGSMAVVCIQKKPTVFDAGEPTEEPEETEYDLVGSEDEAEDGAGVDF